MSAFDDEFGLFGDELPTFEEDERRSTLGARIITSGSEIVIDEIEPEDEDRGRARRGNGPLSTPVGERRPPFRRRGTEERRPSNPSLMRERAIELLSFLAKGLVTKPDMIAVQAHEDHRQGLVLELEVAAEDLGKVIGRGGRVAQALRTVVRAGVEGRVAIEIIDIHSDDSQGQGEVAHTVSDATEAARDAEEQDSDKLVIAQTETQADEEVAPKAPRRPVRRRTRTVADAADQVPEPDAVLDVVQVAPEAEIIDGAVPRPRTRRPRKTVTD
jgi:predicted RNA-binding protein YlqC (UPF0109 family)